MATGFATLRAAKIPDAAWNMDSRAGGATEAFNAGVLLKKIQGAMLHEEESMTLRYIRRNASSPADAADGRNAKRAG